MWSMLKNKSQSKQYFECVLNTNVFFTKLIHFFLVESENLIFNSIYILSENIENQKETPSFHAQSLLVVIKNPAVVFFQAMRAFHPWLPSNLGSSFTVRSCDANDTSAVCVFWCCHDNYGKPCLFVLYACLPPSLWRFIYLEESPQPCVLICVWKTKIRTPQCEMHLHPWHLDMIHPYGFSHSTAWLSSLWALLLVSGLRLLFRDFPPEATNSLGKIKDHNNKHNRVHHSSDMNCKYRQKKKKNTDACLVKFKFWCYS